MIFSWHALMHTIMDTILSAGHSAIAQNRYPPFYHPLACNCVEVEMMSMPACHWLLRLVNDFFFFFFFFKLELYAVLKSLPIEGELATLLVHTC